MKPHKIPLEHTAFRFLRLFLQQRQIYFIAGTHSMFVPSRGEKYMMLSRPDGYMICRDWPDENGLPDFMTPGEAARAELRREFPNLKRVGWQSSHISLFDWRWPMLFCGPAEGIGTYIDLKGAYHQLYTRLWLDTAFPCGYGTLPLVGISERLSDWKAARNSLIGICAARDTVAFKGFTPIKLTTHNPYLSPGLWATIQAILNEIALEAESLGAIYIATDGYIFPSTKKAEQFEAFLIDHSLKYRSISGIYDIRSWGNYRISKKQTQAYTTGFGQGMLGRAFRSINVKDARHPFRLLRWWSKSISHYSNYKWETVYNER